MAYKHAVIAGVNKCGTTSVFRYLADHPEVCGSSIKELRFFLQESYDESKSTIEEYRSHFASIKSGDVLLEASPSYFRGERTSQIGYGGSFRRSGSS